MPPQLVWWRRVGQATSSTGSQVKYLSVRTAGNRPPKAAAGVAARPGHLVTRSTPCSSKLTSEHSRVLVREAQPIQKLRLSCWPASLTLGLCEIRQTDRLGYPS